MPKNIETVGEERCWTKFNLLDSNLDEGTFRGIASVFGSLVNSWMPTIIESGAFTKTLQESGKRVKLLWQHDASEPIGVPTALAETDQGLEVIGKISRTTRGRDALILMRDGVVDELSIGFDPIKWEMEDRGNGDVVRHVKEVRLWEISAVTFAADPLARIQAIHKIQNHLLTIPLNEFAAKWEIQSVICPKDKWDSLQAAKKWCSDHDYKTDKVDETEDSYRFRQKDPGEFAKFRTICINPGKDTAISDCKVKAVYGQLKSSDQSATPSITDLEPVFAELHEGKVISKKNKKLLSDAIAALEALLSAAEPPSEEKKALTGNQEQLIKLASLQMWASQNL